MQHLLVLSNYFVLPKSPKHHFPDSTEGLWTQSCLWLISTSLSAGATTAILNADPYFLSHAQVGKMMMSVFF